MTYRLVRLAPGSYDLELDGGIVASVVRDGHRGHHAVRWFAELLDETGTPPAPFTEAVHEFGSFDEAAAWLGYPDTVSLARVAYRATSRCAVPPKAIVADPSAPPGSLSALGRPGQAVGAEERVEMAGNSAHAEDAGAGLGDRVVVRIGVDVVGE